MVGFKITQKNKNSRLDLFINSRFPTLSRAFIQKLSKSGRIKVNDEVTKTGYKLRVGDRVKVDYDEKKPIEIPEINVPVIYEDNDCIVIDKPIGLLVHSKGAFNSESTVASWLADKITDMTGERAGIVHRLDRATSGVMICAKNPVSHKWLQKQFSLRKVKKKYIAVVKGDLEPREALIDMPIERNPKAPATFRVGPNGKSAQTHYRIVKSGNGYSLVELYPTTGRTHQLRVHLAKLNHPIVGDLMYRGDKGKRLYLHAESLEITLPSRERKIFISKTPPEFNDMIY